VCSNEVLYCLQASCCQHTVLWVCSVSMCTLPQSRRSGGISLLFQHAWKGAMVCGGDTLFMSRQACAVMKCCTACKLHAASTLSDAEFGYYELLSCASGSLQEVGMQRAVICQ
jgi:hypothetical protein